MSVNLPKNYSYLVELSMNSSEGLTSELIEQALLSLFEKLVREIGIERSNASLLVTSVAKQ